MDTLDKLFITTAQNIIGSNIKICKWSFIFTSIGVGINILLNSFYFTKINNENKMLKNKLDALLNEQKVMIESNITIYDFIKKNLKSVEITVHDKNVSLQEKIIDNEVEGYDFLYYDL
jgi:hypothetical protein